MTELQKKMFLLLLDFHKLCEINNIKYSLHGGTLLGAVRDKSFIPWDDDIDIALSRKDFNKLLKSLNKNEEIEISYKFTPWIPAIYYKDLNNNINDDVRMDLFIYDDISNNRCFKNIKIYLLKFIQGMMKPKLNINGKKMHLQLLLIISYVIGGFFTTKFKRKLYNHISIKLFNGKRRCVFRSNDSFKGLSEIFEKKLIQDFSKVTFEKLQFSVFRKYEKILIASFGNNYMEPIKYLKEV